MFGVAFYAEPGPEKNFGSRLIHWWMWLRLAQSFGATWLLPIGVRFAYPDPPDDPSFNAALTDSGIRLCPSRSISSLVTTMHTPPLRPVHFVFCEEHRGGQTHELKKFVHPQPNCVYVFGSDYEGGIPRTASAPLSSWVTITARPPALYALTAAAAVLYDRSTKVGIER